MRVFFKFWFWYLCSFAASSKASPTRSTVTNLRGLFFMTMSFVWGSTMAVSANQGHRATCWNKDLKSNNQHLKIWKWLALTYLLFLLLWIWPAKQCKVRWSPVFQLNLIHGRLWILLHVLYWPWCLSSWLWRARPGSWWWSPRRVCWPSRPGCRGTWCGSDLHSIDQSEASN